MARVNNAARVLSADNPWGWRRASVSEKGITWDGYVMHSSPAPREPEMLCRWAIYKTGGMLIVIALNGKVFGYQKTGLIIDARARVERIASMMGHSPAEVKE